MKAAASSDPLAGILPPAAAPGGAPAGLAADRDAGAGLVAHTVAYLAACKGEPGWLRAQRRGALPALDAAALPPWAPAELAEIPFDRLRYYTAPAADDPAVGDLLVALGARREAAAFLAGMQVQVDGEIMHGTLRENWTRAGVVFTDASRGLTEHGALFRSHFGSVVARDENLFTRLNAALFSGGSFIHVPAGVKVTAPLKCFMHLQARHGAQFGRTLVVLGAGAELTFIEGCTSAAAAEPALHCAVGEFVLGPGARLHYVSLQDWAPHVFNLAMLRARVAAGASVQWIDCNLGGRLTMKYPCALLEGEGASAEAVSISVARTGQRHDSGAKMFHRAPRTSSTLTAKSVSLGAGRADYRGWVDLPSGLSGCRNHTECDALLVDPASRTDTYPAIHVGGTGGTAQHEATVSRLGADQIFYMRSRGLSESAARSLSINGFISNLVERFPLQYSHRIRRLIELQMEGSVG